MTELQPFTVPAGSRVYLGEPADEPRALLDAIGAALAGVPAVRGARRVWAMVENGTPGLVVGIDVEPDEAATRREAMAAVSRALAVAPAAFPLGVVFVGDRGELVAWMAANAAPFFPAANH